MHHQRGNVVLYLVLIIALLAAISYVGYTVWWQRQHPSTTTTTTTTTTASTGVCSDLQVSKGSSDGTAGTIYWHAVITNNGTVACKLTGYPAAFMVDASATTVGAVDNALYPVTTVTLAAHGGQAHAVVGLPEAANFAPGTTTCTDAASSDLHLYLPGIATLYSVPFGVSGCQGFTVTTIQAGA